MEGKVDGNSSWEEKLRMMGWGGEGAGTDESQWENVRVDRSCFQLENKGSLLIL